MNKKKRINPDFTFSFGYLPLVKMMGVPFHKYTPRKEGDERILFIYYKLTLIAMIKNEEGVNQRKEAEKWVNTHGYLAEWIRQKYLTGEKVSWTDDMRISPVHEEWVVKTYKNREEANGDSFWDIQEFKKQYPWPRYETFVNPSTTTLICVDTFPQNQK